MADVEKGGNRGPFTPVQVTKGGEFAPDDHMVSGP